MINTTDQSVANWVMDSGATCNATYDEKDCCDVRDCMVKVNAAGSSFTVRTASIKRWTRKAGSRSSLS